MTQVIKSNGTKFPSVFTDFFEGERLFPREFFSNEWEEWMPHANVSETGKEYLIELSVPGMKKKEIHVSVKDDMLTIKGEHEEENKEKTERFTRKEFHYGSFNRSFRLPAEVKEDAIEAKFDNGILKLRIPKTEKAVEKPKKEIKVG